MILLVDRLGKIEQFRPQLEELSNGRVITIDDVTGIAPPSRERLDPL